MSRSKAKSRKVRIENKHTGEVSMANPGRSMQTVARKNSPQSSLEIPNSDHVGVNKDVVDADQEDRQQGQQERSRSAESSAGEKSSKVEIGSLCDFVVYAYSRKGQSLRALRNKEVNLIKTNATLTEQERDKILAMSKKDLLLAVPRHVILSAQEFNGLTEVRRNIRLLIPEVLKQHAIYRLNNLVPVIANLDDAIEPVEAIQIIASLSQETLASLAGLEKSRPKDTEALRSNAINCLAMWLWESRGLPIKKIVDWLHNGYWSTLVPSGRDSNEILRVVTGITDIEGVGTASQWFKAEADEHGIRATKLQATIDRLNNNICGLEQTIRNLQEAVDKRDKTIELMSEELDAERSAHANSRAHLGDDREHLRSKAVRSLNREVSLLTEGLQALRKDPPKVRVMDDHAERVLEGLRATIQELEEEG